MFCGRIRFWSKWKVSTLEEFVTLGRRRRRSGAPTPPEWPESLVTPEREKVMEPGVETRFHTF